MSELEFIVDQLKRAFVGEAWHGPALMEVLEGVDAETASARPIPAGHSIWELVLHIAAWEEVITRRITTRQPATLTDAENFPAIKRADEVAWKAAVQSLRAAHEQLIQVASKLSKSQLNDSAPGKDYDIRFMLMGAPQHAAYHGGQIALLKRAVMKK